MTLETEKLLLERLAALESEVAELKADNRFAGLSPNSIVGKDYVAQLFGCSETAVLRGRCGTQGLKPVRFKPLGYLKSQVDRWHREYTKSARDIASEAIREARPEKRRKSVITR